jgi:hypothetical protein
MKSPRTAANTPTLTSILLSDGFGYWVTRVRTVLCLLLAISGVVSTTTGCGSAPRSAVSMKMSRSKATPRDASVYIDEEFIGPLYYVAAHGVRLPTGRHRITITKDGYFPWDRVVEADRQPVALEVELVPVPD